MKIKSIREGGDERLRATKNAAAAYTRATLCRANR